MRTRWIERPAPLAAPHRRLLCFPYSGGSASLFRPWCDALGAIEVCAVQLPGRQRRIAEAPCRRVDEAVSCLAVDAQSYLDVPLALFGDCTGAFLAFELCRALRRMGRPSPVHLFVSCCRAPHLPRRHDPIHALDEAALKREMQALAVVPAWLLESDDALRQFLPVLRADFEMSETYAYADEAPLDVPITVFAGRQDPITSVAEAEAWSAQTREALRLIVLDGGHDLTHSLPAQLLREVRQACESGAAAAEPRHGVGREAAEGVS